MLELPRCSNEYPQSMFWSKNKKIGLPLQTPVFLYKKWGLSRYTFHGHFFLMLFIFCTSQCSMSVFSQPITYQHTVKYFHRYLSPTCRWVGYLRGSQSRWFLGYQIVASHCLKIMLNSLWKFLLLLAILCC